MCCEVYKVLWWETMCCEVLCCEVYKVLWCVSVVCVSVVCIMLYALSGGVQRAEGGVQRPFCCEVL